MKKVWLVLNTILGGILMTGGALVLEALRYKDAVFGNVTFEQIFFSVTGNMQGANMSVFNRFFYMNLPVTVILVALLMILLIRFRNIKPVYLLWNLVLVIGGLFFAGCTWHGLKELGAIEHYKMLHAESSTLYEDYYVDPNEVEVKFPEEKRNLIYIFLESMENTYMVDHVGGAQDISFIPNLTQLMLDNTYFFNPVTQNGAKVEYGCDWTVAAMLAQSSAIPMCMPNGQNEYETYTTFLPGVTNLGDILKAEGYNLELMMGSDSSFGGRKSLYGTHGNYEIFDYYTAIDRGYITSDYMQWWGFEDRKLFEYAKTELTGLASEEEPFSMTLLTADTHYIEGYVDEDGQDFHKDHYQNALSNSDVMITDFIDWIKKQSFYENTTIVISGDHLNMGGAYISQLNPDYTRTVYSTIINPMIEEDQRAGETYQHEYSTLDMFPTTLVAMGCTIEGDRLGLGTNLFSNQTTLIEELGYQGLYEELSRPSKYYEKNFVVQKDRASAFQ